MDYYPKLPPGTPIDSNLVRSRAHRSYGRTALAGLAVVALIVVLVEMI